MKKIWRWRYGKVETFAFSKACFIWEIGKNFNRYAMGCSYW